MFAAGSIASQLLCGRDSGSRGRARYDYKSNHAVRGGARERERVYQRDLSGVW